MGLNEVEKQLVYEKFEAALPDLVKKAEHCELWGYDLNTVDKVVKERFLHKYLVANDYDLEQAKSQLLKTLKWRKSFNPLGAAFTEQHKDILNETAFVTKSQNSDDNNNNNNPRVTTWNLYGAVKDRKQLFGDLEAFLRWRVGLMEQGIALLDFTNEKTSYMTQIHDYDNVNMFKIDAETKAATKKTIEVFQAYYPELLNTKYFINVSVLMTWMFALVRPFVSQATADKFVVLSDGKKLDGKLGKWVPKGYGGDGQDLKDQQVTKVEPVDASQLDNSATSPAA